MNEEMSGIGGMTGSASTAQVAATVAAACVSLDVLARAADRFNVDVERSAVALDALRRLLESGQ